MKWTDTVLHENNVVGAILGYFDVPLPDSVQPLGPVRFRWWRRDFWWWQAGVSPYSSLDFTGEPIGYRETPHEGY